MLLWASGALCPGEVDRSCHGRAWDAEQCRGPGRRKYLVWGERANLRPAPLRPAGRQVPDASLVSFPPKAYMLTAPVNQQDGKKVTSTSILVLRTDSGTGTEHPRKMKRAGASVTGRVLIPPRARDAVRTTTSILYVPFYTCIIVHTYKRVHVDRSSRLQASLPSFLLTCSFVSCLTKC